MMMRLLSLFLGAFLEKSAGGMPPAGFFERLTAQTVRRFLVILSSLALAFTLFVSGLFTLLLDLVLTSRAVNEVSFSQVAWVGTGLVAASMLTLFLSLRRSTWQATRLEDAGEVRQQATNPLHDALAMLVLDFVEERRAARSAAPSMESQPAASAASAPTPAVSLSSAYEDRLPEAPPVYM